MPITLRAPDTRAGGWRSTSDGPYPAGPGRRVGSWWSPRSSTPTRPAPPAWRVRFPSASAERPHPACADRRGTETPLTDPIIDVRDLTRRFGRRTAIAGLDLAVTAGKVVALMGHNGSGKTTALGCIAGLVRPDDGTVRVAGHDPHREPDAVGARAALALVPTATAHYPDLTTGEHLALVAVAHGGDAEAAEDVGRELGLGDHLDAHPRELSAGLRQRLGLACALVRPRRAILLDEPTSALDPAGAVMVCERLAAERDDGCAIVVATHDPDVVARLDASVVLLAEGREVVRGPLETVRAHPAARALGVG